MLVWPASHQRVPAMRTTFTRPSRAVAAVAGVALLVAGLAWGTTGPIVATIDGSATFEQLVAATTALAAWVLIGWMLLVALCTAVATVPGWLGNAARRCVGRISPAAVRQLARAALGVMTIAAPATTVIAPAAGVPVHSSTHESTAYVAIGSDAAAHAATDATGTEATGTEATGTEATGLPGVGRPPVVVPVLHHDREPDEQDHQSPSADPSPDRPEPVVVAQGDTLWRIAASRLGPDASDAQVAAAWPRWFAANRDEIGPNPDLIQPGMHLYPPEQA